MKIVTYHVCNIAGKITVKRADKNHKFGVIMHTCCNFREAQEIASKFRKAQK
jgi:hypothetical protein